jgi:hypothetical protein
VAWLTKIGWIKYNQNGSLTKLELNCTNMKDNADSRLTQVNVKWICIKIKYGDLIRLLIGWFDLIMGLIKDLIKFNNYFGLKLKETIKYKDFIRLLMSRINFIKDLIGEKLNLKA